MKVVSMKELCEMMTDKFSADVPHPESEYIDDEGFARCSVCHDRVEFLASIPALGIERKVRCICSCIQNKMKADREREKQQDIFRERMKCFSDSNMHTWTFANDDEQNEKLTAAMKNYVKHFTEFRKEGKGLLLYGSVGTGKTYYAACIANALIDEGYSCLMTNFSTLINQIQENFNEKQKVIDRLNRFSLLVIDDLGIESDSKYRQEQIYNIIDARYRAGLPFIVTTNLSAEELKKPSDIGYQRIYDRILERCHPVQVEGQSRRRENLKASFKDTKELLGL